MPQSRSTAEIFEDLRILCRETGFLHAISAVVFRDTFIAVDQSGEVQLDEEQRFSRSRLNNNELMLLVGLLVQSGSRNVFEEVANTEALVTRADKLLEEFHAALEQPLKQTLQKPHSADLYRATFGDFAREAIYYGAESAFNLQWTQFARERYRNDLNWLLSSKGISIRPIIEIATYIKDRVNLQTTVLINFRENPEAPPNPSDISSALVIDRQMLIEEFGQKTSRFLDLFSIPINNSNASFDQAFAFNEVNVRPIINLGQFLYIPNSFRLSESIYDSPYYWMLEDTDYKDIASKHRGEFLERTIERMLRNVFGDEHVHSNVVIRRKKSEIAAEADVLVTFGEFVIVIQAKSKRLTLRARSGDPNKIKDDFSSAVQAAYDQAITFIDLLASGAQYEIGPNQIRKFELPVRAFPIVVLSDHFPSQISLSHQLINVNQDGFPAIIDIFFLDCITRLLNNPIDILYYMQQRTRFFHKTVSDSEYNLLGYHMKHKLYVPDETDAIMIDRSFATDIDDYFFAQEAGQPTSMDFVTLEDRMVVPEIAQIVSFLRSGSPELAGAAIELLDFSSDALQKIANNIEIFRSEVKAGKAFKAFSIETHYGGISYVVARIIDSRTKQLAEAVAHRHKYKFKRDRWYILLDSVDSPNVIDGVLSILDKWTESKEFEETIQKLDEVVSSTFISYDSTDPPTKAE